MDCCCYIANLVFTFVQSRRRERKRAWLPSSAIVYLQWRLSENLEHSSSSFVQHYLGRFHQHLGNDDGRRRVGGCGAFVFGVRFRRAVSVGGGDSIQQLVLNLRPVRQTEAAGDPVEQAVAKAVEVDGEDRGSTEKNEDQAAEEVSAVWWGAAAAIAAAVVCRSLVA